MKLSELTKIKPEPIVKYKFAPDYDLPLPETYVGVEVELEDIYPPIAKNINERSVYWSSKRDGSLRDSSPTQQGWEFVLKSPMYGKDIKESLIQLEDALKKNPYPIKFSQRTSTHVHIDVRDLDVDQVLNILYLYMIFEKVLFKYEGTGRDKNHFCVPLYQYAHSFKNNVVNIKAQNKSSVHGLASFTKYGAINLSASTKYGSIEYRHMHATTKANELLDWIKILMSIHAFALGVVNVYEIPPMISINGVVPFIFQVFGKELAEKLQYDEVDKDIYDGIREAQTYMHLLVEMAEFTYYSSKENETPNEYFLMFKEKHKNLFNESVKFKRTIPLKLNPEDLFVIMDEEPDIIINVEPIIIDARHEEEI